MRRLFLCFLYALFAAQAADAIDINGYLRKAALEPLSSDPSTALTGRVYFNTTTSGAKVYTGSSWQGLGGSGSGEKNYIANGSSSNGGWGVSGAGVTATTDTTAADLPDPSVGTALLVTGVSGSSAYAFYNFTLDPADYNKKLKVALDQACGLSGALTAIANCASGDFKVDVYSCTVAWSGSPATTCSGTTTRLSLSTDASSVSALPALTGTYRMTFDAPGSAAKNIQLRVGLNSTNTHAVAAANVVVGPGVVTQGAAVSAWQSYTPTFGIGLGTVTGINALWRQVGSSIELQVSGTTGTVASSAATVSLPNSYTVLSTLPAANSVVGSFVRAGNLGSYQTDNMVVAPGNNYVAMAVGNATSGGGQTAAGGNSCFVSNETFSFRAVVPVNELAGSGTVNIAVNGPMYACNNNSSTTANTQFSTGSIVTPSGCNFVAVDSATTTNSDTDYKVTFPAPIDQGSVRIQTFDASGNWIDGCGNMCVIGRLRQNTAEYGMWTFAVTGDPSSVWVAFGNAGAQSNGSTYGATGNAWSGMVTNKWRVVAYPSNGATGFAAASDTSFGLVKLPTGYTQTTVPDYETGTFTTTFTGPRTTPTETLYYVRVGKMVTLGVPLEISGTCVTAGQTNFTTGVGVLPTAIRPNLASNINMMTPAIMNAGAAVAQPGNATVGSNGSLNIYRDGISAFSTGSNCGWYPFNITYSIQ